MSSAVPRWLTYVGFTCFGLALHWMTLQYAAHAEAGYVLMLSSGYLSLLLIAVTLVIGPVRLWVRKRANPVNLFLRRDVGICAGIAGCLHVISVLQIHFDGQVLLYFFRLTDEGHYRLLLNGFGIGNHVGVAATLILVLLLLTSNTLSLRLLKGKRWKQLQRFNYALACLALIHTVLFQYHNQRPIMFFIVILVVTLSVVLMQTIGILSASRMGIRT